MKKFKKFQGNLLSMIEKYLNKNGVKIHVSEYLKVVYNSNDDKLNYNNDPQVGGDGFFDFMPGLTIDAQNGRIIFTVKEPFGELLFSKLLYSKNLLQNKNVLYCLRTLGLIEKNQI